MWLGNWYDGSPVNVIDTYCWGVRYGSEGEGGGREWGEGGVRLGR